MILSVVAGHSWLKFTDIIFWFHMPLFFILAGYMLHVPDKEDFREWVFKKTKRLMIPYFVYFFISCLLEKNLTIGHTLRVVWGGRAVSEVYWFVTCLLLSYCLLAVMELYLPKKVRIFLILMMYVLAVFLSCRVLVRYNGEAFPLKLCLPGGVISACSPCRIWL